MSNASMTTDGRISGQLAEMAGERFMKVSEAARFLGLSVAKLYLLMGQGELAYARFGKARRIPEKALVEFIRRNTVPAAASGAGPLAQEAACV